MHPLIYIIARILAFLIGLVIMVMGCKIAYESLRDKYEEIYYRIIYVIVGIILILIGTIFWIPWKFFIG